MSYEVEKFIKPCGPIFDQDTPVQDTEEDLRIFRLSANMSASADDVRAYLWPENEKSEVISELLDFARTLQAEWAWRRGSSRANDAEMAQLDAAIERAEATEGTK